MKLTQKFNLRSMNPQSGGLSGFWISVAPTEVANAVAAGTGPGVADDNGTPTPGNIQPGHLMQIEGPTADFCASIDLTAAPAVIPYIVFSGDDDFSGSFVGEAILVHGPGRLDTEKYDAGSYSPGDWLIASAVVPGNFAKKATGDHKQMIAKVGPRGTNNGVMDVIFIPGVNGQSI